MNYLYVLTSTRFLYRAKIGISERPATRRREIGAELGCKVYGVYLPMLFARHFEQALHKFYAWWNCKVMPHHAGKTEWFYFLNPLAMFFACLGVWAFDLQGLWLYTPLLALVLPLPVDIVLCVALYFYAQLWAVRFLWPVVAWVLETLLNLIP